MRKTVVSVVLTLLAIVALPTVATVTTNLVAYHSDSVAYQYPSDRGDGNGNNGGDYGDNDNRRCHNSENCRGSFSPGPFDRSPVDIHDNQFCVSPDCSGHSDSGSNKGNDGKKGSK